MGYAYKQAHRDLTHAPIVAALKAAGCHVTDLSAVGGGCPDVAIAFRGHLSFMEFKSPGTHARRAKGDLAHLALCTDDQIAWLAEYGDKGPPVRIVTSAQEALDAIGAGSYPPPVEPSASTPAAAAKGG